MARHNKTIEQQSKYYEEDFKDFLIKQWVLGYSIYKYYMELSVKERFKIIQWLICYTPHPDWTKIILYLLNPETSRNKGNRINK